MMQALTNALISAAGYLLVGVGFALIYRSTRFFHFAHGIVLTVGAYVTFTLKVWIGLPLWIAIIGGIVASVLLGAAMELSVYKPLRRRGASAAILLLASLGMYVALQAVVVLVFGSGTQTFRTGDVPEGLAMLGARITWPQITTIMVSGTCGLLTWLLIERSRIGKMLRAVACDCDLAQACGVRGDWVIMVAFLLGSSIAGLAAILLAFDQDMTPMMGFQLLLMGMIAVIIGGVGNIPGTALGAVVLGLAQHLTAWWLSSKWQDAIVFAILVLFLLVRPQGFLGKPLRKVVV